MNERTETFTLGRLEDMAIAYEREERERQREKEREEQRRQAENRVQLTAAVLDYWTELGVDRGDLARALTVNTDTLPEEGYRQPCNCTLELSHHAPIHLRMYAEWQQAESEDIDDRTLVVKAPPHEVMFRVDGSYHGNSLAQALLSARRVYRLEERRRRQEEQAEAERQKRAAAREQHRQDVETMRQEWLLTLVERHPILIPLLQVLGEYLRDTEALREDLHSTIEADAEFAIHLQARLAHRDERIEELDAQIRQLEWELRALTLERTTGG